MGNDIQCGFASRCYRCCYLLTLSILSFTLNAQIPFNKGVNLTQWFQASAPRQIQFTRFTRKDFENIKSLGCDVIRLPINLHAMTSGAPDYTLDTLFLHFLDHAVSWSEELELYLILDNHSFDPAINTEPEVENILVKVWSQLAKRYTDRSSFLLYEILNEPHGISDALWGAIQQSVIDAIRAEDSDHYIIVGGSNYNNYMSLENLPLYTDERLIYTFHFYDPFLFTHQGASWVGPSLVSLTDIPFPFSSGSMPSLPSEFNGTWIASAYNNYSIDGTVSKVKQLLDIAVNFKTTRNVPVFCGEFGVYIPNSDPTDRVDWYNEVRGYLDQNDIPWTIWDYTGGFGVFEPNSNELFEYDLNVQLLEVLDLVVPPQKNFSKKPKTDGFIIYDDYVGQGILTSNYTGAGSLDYYDNTIPSQGNYAIRWSDVSQYESIGFDFSPDVDLSLMPASNYELSFWVRGNSPEATFDVRFIDTKTGDSDHPWRMGKTINEEMGNWDGEWHQIAIPLSSLEEKGSWDNGWFSPEGKFQWSAVDRFEIVAEQHAMTGIEFYFDDIQLVGDEITIVLDAESPSSDADLIIYPNPMVSESVIEFSATGDATIVSVADLQGRQVCTLLDTKELSPGRHMIVWAGDDNRGQPLSNGIYMVRIQRGKTYQLRRLVVLNK